MNTEENRTAEQTVPYDRLLQILQDYVNNDYEGAEPEYVREALTDICGCTRDEIDALGFGWMFADEN